MSRPASSSQPSATTYPTSLQAVQTTTIFTTTITLTFPEPFSETTISSADAPSSPSYRPTSSTASHPYTSSSSPLSSIPTPTIAGAATGGTAFLAIAIGAALYLVRRKKRRAATPRRWDTSAGIHARPMLPDVEGGEKVGYVGAHGVGMGKYDGVKKYDGVEKYDGVGSGRVGGRIQELETRATASLPMTMHNMPSWQSGANQGVGRGVGSEYPGLESRTPSLAVSPASPHTVHKMQSWHSGPLRVDDDIGSLVSELGGTSPLVRMGAAELGGADVVCAEMDGREKSVGGGCVRYCTGTGF
jgi:hypothetical protein